MLWTEYYGWVSMEFWEYSVMFFYLVGMYLYFARQKNLRVKQEPEYRFFLWGLYAKLIGGISFGLIYFYHYHGGDTIGYFYSALPFSKLFKTNPTAFFQVIFSDNTIENLQYFTRETGYPYAYLYYDDRSYMLLRLIAPISIISFDSYLITTVTVASISYIGVWRCYQTFLRYFPKLQTELAIAFLFMPSCIFWGSSILKDTFSFAAVCWYLHCFDNIVFRKRDRFSSFIALAVSVWLILALKPYIFMAIFPISLLWMSYNRLARFRNALVKYILLPAVMVVLFGLSFYVISSLGGQLGKFSLENALGTITTIQDDMKRSEQYGNNYFDIGELEADWASVLSKFPVAVNATLFRPYIWECNNLVMVLAGLENLFILGLTLTVLFRARILGVVPLITRNPVVLLCMAFSLVYGFLTGISTPNFGALVRFKIPLLPLFVGGLYIMRHLMERRQYARQMGLRFDLADFVGGDPDTHLAPERRERR